LESLPSVQLVLYPVPGFASAKTQRVPEPVVVVPEVPEVVDVVDVDVVEVVEVEPVLATSPPAVVPVPVALVVDPVAKLNPACTDVMVWGVPTSVSEPTVSTIVGPPPDPTCPPLPIANAAASKATIGHFFPDVVASTQICQRLALEKRG